MRYRSIANTLSHVRHALQLSITQAGVLRDQLLDVVAHGPYRQLEYAWYQLREANIPVHFRKRVR